eukprot:43597-Prorocentrum_minimum.AAC.3
MQPTLSGHHLLCYYVAWRLPSLLSQPETLVERPRPSLDVIFDLGAGTLSNAGVYRMYVKQ